MHATAGHLEPTTQPQADSSAAAEYAELQLHLYADYAPKRLMDFLVRFTTRSLARRRKGSV